MPGYGDMMIALVWIIARLVKRAAHVLRINLHRWWWWYTDYVPRARRCKARNGFHTDGKCICERFNEPGVAGTWEIPKDDWFRIRYPYRQYPEDRE